MRFFLLMTLLFAAALLSSACTRHAVVIESHRVTYNEESDMAGVGSTWMIQVENDGRVEFKFTYEWSDVDVPYDVRYDYKLKETDWLELRRILTDVHQDTVIGIPIPEGVDMKVISGLGGDVTYFEYPTKDHGDLHDLFFWIRGELENMPLGVYESGVISDI